MTKRRPILPYSLIAMIFLILLIGGSSARAASIVVNTAADLTPSSTDGLCSLREAITAANTDTASGATPGECAAGSGADRITFAGNYTITLVGSDLPSVKSEITITGNGQTRTIIEASACNPVTLPGGCTSPYRRVLSSSGDLTLEELTIRHGNAFDIGGGINTFGGTLTIRSCAISDNYALFGAGIGTSSSGELAIYGSTFSNNQATSEGGAIYNHSSLITIITDSTFSSNFAYYFGGGISNNSSIHEIDAVTFSDNSAAFSGASIHNHANLTTIKNSTFSGNAASYGGGISNSAGAAITEISRSTFSNNYANVNPVFWPSLPGGGIWNAGAVGTIDHSTFANNNAFRGAGIHNSGTITAISNSTLHGNQTIINGQGGGIYNDGGTIATITSSTLSNNKAYYGGGIYNDGTITVITNSTLSQNSARDYGGGIYNFDSINSISSSTFYGNYAEDFGNGILNDSLSTIGAITNTIFASSTGDHCQGPQPAASTNNLTDGNDCWTWPNAINPTTHLGPLSDNGGPTQTHPLLFSDPANPAINNGNDPACGLAPVNGRDQRGVNRASFGACDVGAFEYTGADLPLTVIDTDPAASSVVQDLTQITVSFSKDVVSDFGADAANHPANYMLVEPGSNGTIDTTSCAGGLQADDNRITINSASYNGTNFTATIDFTPSPLPVGSYRLFICGTTSIHDTIGLELNGGLTDTQIDLTVSTAPNTLPDTGFAPGQVTILSKQPAEKVYNNYPNIRLEIPRLGLEMDIVTVPMVEGEWDVTWLANQAGYLEGTAFPTWAGNTVLTAHVWDAWNRPGPFIKLKSLAYGDHIRIHAFGQIYTYQVQTNTTVLPDQTEKVLQHQEYDWVTLLTCEHFNPFSGDYRHRRVVRAILVDLKPE